MPVAASHFCHNFPDVLFLPEKQETFIEEACNGTKLGGTWHAPKSHMTF